MMSEITVQEPMNDNLKTKVLIVGGVVGALVGVMSAYLLIQNRDKEEFQNITPGEGVKLGVLVLSLLRSIATLGEGK